MNQVSWDNMDIIDRVKQIFRNDAPNIVQGAPDAYDKAQILTDEELKKWYMGKAPYDPKTKEVIVPREVQEELYKRFVKPHADFQCQICWGRGHAGWLPQINQLKPCECLQRTIRHNIGEENQKIILMN